MSEPTVEQWRTAYAMAEQVREMAPYQWMSEAALFMASTRILFT